MRTLLIIIGGVAALGGSLLVARWVGAGWRTPFADVGKFSGCVYIKALSVL